MRYAPEHKAEVHQKIVKDAARRVRAEGLNGAAVSTVMKDAGLTHGGFYKHFESKDDLLVASLQEGFREIVDRLAHAGEESGTAWKGIVKTYLSPEHCRHADRGCPVAALAPELARADKTMKGKIVEQMVQYKNKMVPFMPGGTTAEKERAFFTIFSMMIGAVSLARILPDPVAQDKVLASAREHLLGSF